MRCFLCTYDETAGQDDVAEIYPPPWDMVSRRTGHTGACSGRGIGGPRISPASRGSEPLVPRRCWHATRRAALRVVGVGRRPGQASRVRGRPPAPASTA